MFELNNDEKKELKRNLWWVLYLFKFQRQS